MWFHHADHFEIITDTMAADLNHRYVGDEQKFRVFPERKLLVAVTGLSELAYEWWRRLESGHPPGGFNDLAQSAPSVLSQMWGTLQCQFEPRRLTATVYHFGFDRNGTAVQAAYDSRSSFAERDRSDLPRFAVKPHPARRVPSAPEGDGELISLALQVRREQQARGPGGVPIGGALMRTRFNSSGRHASEELFRFVD